MYPSEQAREQAACADEAAREEECRRCGETFLNDGDGLQFVCEDCRYRDWYEAEADDPEGDDDAV